MKLLRRNFLHLCAGAAALPAVSRIANAQAYPTRPITMIVPFPAGGPLDTIARLLAVGMRPSLGQPIIVENVGGAAGSTGVGRAALAAPDGHTLILGHWGTHVVNGAIYALQYDVLTDFAPIALLASNPAIILAKKAIPADDLKTLIAWLKASFDKSYVRRARRGQCSAHLRCTLSEYHGHTLAVHSLPRRRADDARPDRWADRHDHHYAGGFFGVIRTGQVKAYAVTAKSRLTAAPDIPTVDEAGLPGFYTLNWTALWRPRQRPRTCSPNSIGRSWDVRRTLSALASRWPGAGPSAPRAANV